MLASVPSPELDALPIPRTRFIGRESERETASVLLLDDAVPLLTLTGPGGVGKTRLALAIAERVAPQFADGVVFVDLAPLGEAGFVATAIATELGITPAIDQPVAGSIASHLRTAQSLLLLDNCEHVLPAVWDLVSVLLAQCPALQVLATSRAALHVRGEHILHVPPLELPQTGSGLDEVRIAPATALFVQRARAVDPKFVLTVQNADAVAEVCRSLDGLPLAIELAAVRSHVLSPAALLALLSERLRVLGTGPRDAPPRHQTIQEAIAWSYDLLEPEDQAFFRRLAVFAGSWTLEAAAAVCDVPLPDALLFLESLVDQSLVLIQSDADALVPRFAMLETIRAFGLQRLEASGEENQARDQHAAFFRALVAELGLSAAFPGDASWFDLVAPEEDNLRLALETVLNRGDDLALSEMSGSLEAFWLTRCQFSEGRRWLELAIARDADLSMAIRSRNRGAAGVFILYHGDSDIAVPILEEAVAMARVCGELFPLEQSLQALGNAYVGRGEFSRAMATLEEAESVARSLGSSVPHAGLFVGANLCFQGVAAARAGDRATAVARFENAVPFLRVPGSNRRLGMLLSELGVIQISTLGVKPATPTLIESVALTWTVGDFPTISRTLRGHAAVAALTQQPIAAAQLLGSADAVDAAAPGPSRGTRRDRDIVELCLLGLAGQLEPDALQRERSTGSALKVDQAIALARLVATKVLGAEQVNAIWHATGARDPGPPPEISSPDRSPLPGAASRWELTRREQEVLQLLCQRYTDLEIAQMLFISPRTASGHVANVMGKLGAANRREAAAIAARNGLA